MDARNGNYPDPTVPEGRCASRLSWSAQIKSEDAAVWWWSLDARWKTEDGTIIERDYLHETVEVYDASGRRHLGEFDPWDGRQISPPDPTRSVEP